MLAATPLQWVARHPPELKGSPIESLRYHESDQYDPLYRLQEVDDQTGAPWQSYAYTKTGDRLSKTTQGITPVDTYNYTTGTHHLIGISGADASNRAFDANGNTTAFQANGWMYGLGYDDRNRLRLVQQNGNTIVGYTLDGKGERVRKAPTSGAPTNFLYDEQGRLLSESSVGGSRAYVWADDTLVATVNGSGTVNYVHTDHLGTPRAVTTTAGTTIWAWPWLRNPFGEQPASGSAYTLNLRYPGQYYDQETGLNYNYFRDYEAGTGRYIESDPIGLEGGISTYTYIESDPLNGLDAEGLSSVPVGCNGGCHSPAPGLPPGPSPFPQSPGAPGSLSMPDGIAGALGGLMFDTMQRMCKDKECPPCRLVDGTIVLVGTIGYRYDRLPSTKIQHGIAGSHLNIYKANRNPNNCRCFWQPMGAVPPPPQPDWIPIQEFAPPY